MSGDCCVIYCVSVANAWLSMPRPLSIICVGEV